jgi:hypothetical protein
VNCCDRVPDVETRSFPSWCGRGVECAAGVAGSADTPATKCQQILVLTLVQILVGSCFCLDLKFGHLTFVVVESKLIRSVICMKTITFTHLNLYYLTHKISE